MAMTVAQLMVKVGADVRDAEAGLGSISGRLSNVAAEAGKVGAVLSAGLTLPLAGLAKSAVDTAVDYESSMNLMRAVSGATDEDMRRVSETAKALGADMSLPATSAADAGKAMVELAKAGLSVEQSMAAARGVLQLSAAGAIDNARAAEIAANALNAFKLPGEDASRVANLLAAAANASSAEVNQLADSLQMSSAVFASAGVGIDGLVAAISQMANAGIQGSDAGTSLKSMLLALQSPSKQAAELMAQYGINIYDAQGKMLPFVGIIEQFSDKLGPLTQQQRDFALSTIFGSDAVRAANVVLMGGVKAHQQMLDAVTKQGAAADLAGARMKGLGGALEGLKSQVETVMLTLAEPFLGTLESMARGLAELVGKLPEVNPQLLAFAGGFLTVLAAAGPVLAIIGALAGGLAFLMTPLGLVISALALLAGAFAADFGGIRTAASGLLDSLRGLLGEAQAIFASLVGVVQQALSGDVGGAFNGLLAMVQVYGGLLWGQLEKWGQQFVAWIGPMIPPLLVEMGNLARQLLDWIVARVPEIAAMLSGWIDSFVDWASEAIPPLLARAGELASQLLGWIKEQVPGLINTLGAWLRAAVNWVADAAVKIVPQLLKFIGSILDWLTANAPTLVQTFLGQWLPAAIGWVAQAAIDILPKLAGLLGTIATWALTEGVPKLLSLGLEMGKAIIGGIGDAMSKLGEALTRWIREQIEKIDFWIGDWVHISGKSGIEWHIPTPNIPNPFGGGGGSNAESDARERYKAWVAAGSPDYNALAAAGVPGFQHGGSFIVGGTGGTDSQLVLFKATPGELVSIFPKPWTGERGKEATISCPVIPISAGA